MTDSNDETGRPDGAGDDETVEKEDEVNEVQLVSSSLRSVQSRECELDAPEEPAEQPNADVERSNVPETDPGGLDELQPVSTSLRSAQSQASDGGAGGADGTSDDDNMGPSDAAGGGDD